MTTRPSALFTIVAAACIALIPGCASRWESTYETTPGMGVGMTASPAAPSEIMIRDVSWDRLNAFREQMGAEIAASDIHPDEWPPERRADAKARLVKALQISEDPATIEVLGRSEFRTTDGVSPDDGSLRRFATSIGATRVIWSCRLLGKADRIVREPVDTYATWPSGYDRDDRSRSSPVPQWSTSWVPVVVQVDESVWVAYFLRDVGR